MRDVVEIQSRIKELYDKKAEIHVDVHSKRPKISVINAPAKITGVYKNLFTVEVNENGLKKIYSIQYTDLFIGKIKILELEKQPD